MRKKQAPPRQLRVKYGYEASYLARTYLEMAYEQLLPQSLQPPQKKQFRGSKQLARLNKSERKIG